MKYKTCALAKKKKCQFLLKSLNLFVTLSKFWANFLEAKVSTNLFVSFVT